jgi:hypothetical protein
MEEKAKEYRITSPEKEFSLTQRCPEKRNPQSDQLFIPLFRRNHKLPESLRELPLPTY